MVFLKPSLRHTPIKIFSVLLFVLTFLLFSVPSSSSSSEDQPIPAPATATYYRVYHIKKTTPYFLKNKQAQQWRRNNKKKKAMEYRRKKMKGSSYIDIDTRAFSTMLPKGFVPPSGNSPCHNDFPNSITFFCQLSSQKP